MQSLSCQATASAGIPIAGSRHARRRQGSKPLLHGVVRRVLAREQAFNVARSSFFRSFSTEWFVKRLRQERLLDWHGDEVTALDFSRSGELLASGSQDTTVGIWNWSAGRLAGSYASGHVSNVVQAKILGTSPIAIATSSLDGSVRFGSAEASGSDNGHTRCVARASNHAPVYQLKPHPANSDILLACALSGQVFCIDLRKKNANEIFLQSHIEPLYSLDIEPLRMYEIALGGSGSAVHLFDLRYLSARNAEMAQFAMYPPRSQDGCQVDITSVAFSASGCELLASYHGYSTDNIALFSVHDAPPALGPALPVKLYKGHSNNLLYGVASFFGQHSEFIVSGSSCGSCMIWRKESGQLLQALPCAVDGVRAVCIHPHCPIVATTAVDGGIGVWCPTSQKPILTGQVNLMAERNQKHFHLSAERFASYQQELSVLRTVLQNKLPRKRFSQVQFL